MIYTKIRLDLYSNFAFSYYIPLQRVIICNIKHTHIRFKLNFLHSYPANDVDVRAQPNTMELTNSNSVEQIYSPYIANVSIHLHSIRKRM